MFCLLAPALTVYMTEMHEHLCRFLVPLPIVIYCCFFLNFLARENIQSAASWCLLKIDLSPDFSLAFISLLNAEL